MFRDSENNIEPRVPSDDMINVLNGIFYFFPENKDRFNYNKQEFKEFFLRKKQDYSALLHKLEVGDYSNYTITQKNILDIARDRMIFEGMLEYIELAGKDIYIIMPECREYFDEKGKIELKKKGLLRQVEKLSMDFQREFAV